MWIKDALTVEWIPYTSSGDVPSPRADHSAFYVAGERDLVVLGGSTSDDTVYVAVIDTVGGSNTAVWEAKAGHGAALSGHTALSGGTDYARIPELFTPPASSPAEIDTLNARLLQEWYPQMFVAPGGLIFHAGPSDTSYAFDLENETWSQYPANSVSGFKGGSAVQYRPGKIMKCGSRDTGNAQGEPVGDAVATTGVIDLTVGEPAWSLIPEDTMSTGRVNHNLVLLPDGDVLAVGGTGKIDNDDLIEPVYTIERWHPSGSGGSWSGAGTLASNPIPRDYHSTALLLPDGRVLSAGGNADHSQYHKANLYCPPYLFRQDGSLASRPVINSAPPAVGYSSNFEVTVTTPGGVAVSSVALLKPAATTHGFDQDQRLVPLTFSGTGTLTLTAPSGTDVAPPGDYLLFVLVAHPDESSEQVPSVAKWIRLSADVTAPAKKNLTVDLVSQTSVGLEWQAPGDDGTANGPAQQYDIRYSSTPLIESGWAGANQPSGEPWPAQPGTYEGYQVTGLQPCTRYWFALKTRDEAYNHSTISDTISAKTICSGGGGGLGETAREVSGEDEQEAVAGPKAPATQGATAVGMAGDRGASAASLRPEAVTLVAEFERTGGATTVRLHRTADAMDGVGEDEPAGIVLQVPGAAGWLTRGRFVPGLQDGLFGLMPPEDRFRYVCREGYDLTHVAERVASPVGNEAIIAATHSVLGDVTDSLAVNGAVQVAAGDTLVVRYGTAEASGSELEWFVLARSTSGTAATAWTRPVPGIVTPRPIAFALHQNQPNPFSRGTTIRFDLPVVTQVRLEVFDLQGRRVRTLAHVRFKPGYHAIEWDHRDDHGNVLRAGIYLYRLRADAFTAQRKMAMVP